MLAARAEQGNPVRVGLIGAGKFGTMFIAQARLMTGIHLVGIADLDTKKARSSCLRTGWPEEQITPASIAAATASGGTCITDSSEALMAAPGLEVVIEATGNPTVGIDHCLRAISAGCHIVMVNVEADVLVGPVLAERAQQAGLVYSLAWGDQPALICEHVDWARSCGFNVVCAGKGTRYHPTFHQSTPDTVWENFHFDRETAERGGMNPKMFNSFIDGSKSAIEMSAVCNATGLTPQPAGLAFPPSSCTGLAEVCKPRADGGTLSHSGTTEVVSSLNRDMTPVENDLMMGTYVVIEADNEYVRNCFEEYRMLPDSSRRYAALYRPTHMIGLELGISVASAALRREPTGVPRFFKADIIATAKRDLKAGEMLDGEGGYCVWGKQVPAEVSLQKGLLPLGFAHDVRLRKDIEAGNRVAYDDVEVDESSTAIKLRREMESRFSSGG
jgi:predicted homoserine dehydrogenase-like protein